MHETVKRLIYEIGELVKLIPSHDLHDQIHIQNEVKRALHAVSPFVNEPVDCVVWVNNAEVRANDYNPNSVAPPEMQLLEVSIFNDGYTQPIVTWEADGDREVIDGFHRNRVGKESSVIRDRIHGYLPVVTANKTDKGSRIASTIRHNRARGKHAVSAMIDIVIELKKRNWSEARISKELGMDEDEILRLCQISGLAEAFENEDFNLAWESAIHKHDIITDVEFENIV